MQATLERLRQRREELGDEGGFTLIELLIVIVILGILAAIVVFAVQNLTSQSASASCKSDLKIVQTAAEVYKAQVGHYPQVGDNEALTPGGAPGAPLAAGGDGLTALYTTQTGVDNSTVGQWLKNKPINGTLYTITLNVGNPGATPPVAGGVIGTTGSQADGLGGCK